MSEQKHAVVTGGAGFVGSHLVDRLLEDGFRVTSLDNYGSGQQSNLVTYAQESALTERKHDIRQPFPEFSEVDQIYHLASRASPADFKDFAIEIAETNSQGTKRVYELALEHDARVIVASTSEVYGNPEVHPQSEDYHGRVNVRGPRAPYDESKRFAESLGVAYMQEHDIDIRTMRIFNTYGPRMRINDGRVIPNFITQALSGQALTVHGTGEQTRSFCYVSDLVEGIRRLGETAPEKVTGSVFNLGNTNEISIIELAETVIDVVGTDSGITHVARPEDDPELRRPDIGRAQRVLDWEPQVDLKTGLNQTLPYFREAFHSQ